MKKVSLLMLVAMFLFCGNLSAQLSFDFEGYNAGDKIAATIGDPWTTWSSQPGSAEDGVFGEAGGSMAAHFTFGNDQIVNLGDIEAGVYDLEFDVYVPEGKNAYFNVLHDFNGQGSTWAMQVYLHMTNDGQNSTMAPGQGTVHAGSNGTANIPAVYEEWMHFRVHIDMDNDVATLFYNETEMCTWQWSLDSFGENTVGRKLDAMNFFPPEDAATSDFYIDNLSVTSAGADQVLIEDLFEEYTVGNKIAEEAQAVGNDWWTTWSENPGSAEDGVIADLDGTQCGHLTFGNDQVLLLGGVESGTYDLEFDILVPEGKNAYFNILHDFNGQGSTWAMQAYLHMTNDGQTSTHAPGHGTVHAGSNATADVPAIYDEWMHFRLHVDTDADVAEYYYTMPGEEEVLVCTWQWSLDSFGENTVGRKLDAMDFFPPEDAATSEYYLDNFRFTRIGGESHATLNFDTEAVEVYVEEDDIDAVTIGIENTGTSIGDWTAWVDFGEGEGGSTTNMVNYDGEPGQTTSLVGLTTEEPILLEVGAMYPAVTYGNSVMGTQITKAQYYLGESQSGGNGLEPGTPLTFRIYGQGLNGQPGEMLAEKVVPASSIVTNDWNIVTFDTPVTITGYNVWATVEFTQAVEGYAMNFDGMPLVEHGDYYRSNGGGAFSQCSEVFSEQYGNFHIRVTCQGTPINGGWASLSKPEGSMPIGGSDEVDVNINTFGFANGETYEADIIFKTNDPAMPELIIPLTLHVGPDGVIENVANAYDIYPNPTTGQVTIAGEGVNYIAIYNSVGQLINVVKNVNNVVDMSAYENGVYFFNIVDNAGASSVQRVVVAK